MKNITLNRWDVSRYDDKSPFILESGDLSLHFVLSDGTGQYFVVSKSERAPIKNGYASVKVKEGTLELCVKRYIDGRFVEAFPIEPLEVKSVDGELTAFPQITTLQTAAKDLYEKAAQLEKSISGVSEKGEKERETSASFIHSLALALFSFAYTDYKNNIYINNRELSAKAFLEVFGFSEQFTEEEIETMNKETLL